MPDKDELGWIAARGLLELIHRHVPRGRRRLVQSGLCKAMSREGRCLRRSLNRLTRGQLRSALGFLDVRPGELADAVGLSELIKSLEHTPSDPLEAFCHHAAALGRRYGEPPTLTALRGLTAAAEPDAAMLTEMGEIDTLRASAPRCAAIRAESLAEGAQDVITAAHACASWASALRPHRLAHAAMVLGFAIEVAEEHQRLRLLADCAQRAVYIAGDQGRHDLGVVLAERALALWTECGVPGRCGQAMVDRGVMFYHLAQYRRAIGAYRSALRHPIESRSYIYAANQGLGFSYYRLGDLERAARYAERAGSQAGELGFLRGYLVKLQAYT